MADDSGIDGNVSMSFNRLSCFKNPLFNYIAYVYRMYGRHTHSERLKNKGKIQNVAFIGYHLLLYGGANDIVLSLVLICVVEERCKLTQSTSNYSFC